MDFIEWVQTQYIRYDNGDHNDHVIEYIHVRLAELERQVSTTTALLQSKYTNPTKH